ncbi:MAG: TauD/TfdA family dioxygenase [Rhodospirillales bacterium]|jgi:alpha-ketoglutarate-dependent taurine dioxygenase|nr:TauD/TfdA family dioxygenase [Rhodospirillales bacterium]MDP7652765.1 TauD/TfdA family dioxygenase [Rhodospirillales bacterium]
MTIEFRPITDSIGAEAIGVDLSQPLDEETFAALNQAWLDHTVLLFRGQDMSVERQKSFSLRLGTALDIHIQTDYLLDDHPEVLVLSNLKTDDGKPVGTKDGGRHWHSDLYWKDIPAKASLLYGRECPPVKGETLFINMGAVYEALPDETKQRVDGKKILISRVRSWPIDYPHRPPLTDAEKAILPDVFHPLVRTHPETGRKCLYIGNEASAWIVGMDDDEGKALIDELMDFARQPRFVYAHKWQAGDALLWDNRSTMHCATPYDEINHRRLMYRTTIMDGIHPA